MPPSPKNKKPRSFKKGASRGKSKKTKRFVALGFCTLIVFGWMSSKNETVRAFFTPRILRATRPSMPNDKPPQITLLEKPFITTRKTIRLAYKASDDVALSKILLRVAPQDQATMQTIDIPLETTSAKSIHTASYAELTSLPWAGQPVTLRLMAWDGAGKESLSRSVALILPTRHFKNPFAGALVEERARLLKDPSPATRNEAANIMAGLARQIGKMEKDTATVLALRAGAVRLVISQDESVIENTAAILWRAALRIEEGMTGLSRETLLKAEMELTGALGLNPDQARLRTLILGLNKAAEDYFKTLESEKSRAAPVLKELANVSLGGQESSSREYFQASIEEIEQALKNKNTAQAQNKLAALHAQIENLPTTLPDLSPAQDRLASQLSALDLLVQAQKALLQATEKLIAAAPQESKGKKERLKTAFDNQQEILDALNSVIAKTQLAQMEITESRRAMTEALASLRQGNLPSAQKQQAEALALLENSVLLLSERMKQSLALVAPSVTAGQ